MIIVLVFNFMFDVIFLTFALIFSHMHLFISVGCSTYTNVFPIYFIFVSYLCKMTMVSVCIICISLPHYLHDINVSKWIIMRITMNIKVK